MRKKYYHAAIPETMEKIIADGVVKRGWDGCVYLCEKPQDAAKFVAIRGHDEVAVIEVILPANKVKESFDHSVQFFQCKAFIYVQDQFNDDYEVRDVIEAFYDCMIEKVLNYIGAE